MPGRIAAATTKPRKTSAITIFSFQRASATATIDMTTIVEMASLRATFPITRRVLPREGLVANSAKTGRAMLASPDERVCLDARRDGVVLARPLAEARLLAAGGAVGLCERSHRVVTTEKVSVLDGTLRRRASAVRLRTVENLELEQSLPGRLLGYGPPVAGPPAIAHV